ncbi:hypothetical protein [Aliiruegeria sabulilitoris]|uniref:hypothetical protein n=1 Tax=Aliiruegeria sabulilitoris TaxID=1510458 RepID=UPI00082E3EA9|nr:hypothetical protein [Aliiruegeria sabulilitoris]NDR55882.1 hypothetical protein [Pseudoruegeria sp. M32A2M]
MSDRRRIGHWILVFPLLFFGVSIGGALSASESPDKVFVQCGVVQGNGYNWASTMGWLSAQVELAALRAQAFEDISPGKRAAIDLSCFVGSSSGGFITAVLDHLLSNERIRGDGKPPDDRRLNVKDARELSRALLFLALSSNFDAEKRRLFVEGIGSRLALEDRSSNATGRRWWRPSASAPENIEIFWQWVLGAQAYAPDWFDEMERDAGLKMPVLATRPRTLSQEESASAKDGMRRLAKAARKVLDERLREKAYEPKTVGDGICITSFALPMEDLARPFDYEALQLVFVCNRKTRSVLADSETLRLWLTPERQMTKRIRLAEQEEWPVLANVSVREPNLMTQLSGKMESHNGLKNLGAFDGSGSAPSHPDAEYLMFGGFAGPRMEAWSAATILLDRMRIARSEGIDADGRIAVFGRIENRDDPGASFAQNVMVEYFTQSHRSDNSREAMRLLERYYAWQDEFCEIDEGFGKEVSNDFYRFEWNLGHLPAAVLERSHELAATGYNLVKLQTKAEKYPEVQGAFWSAFLFDPNDAEGLVQEPPEGGMTCRLQERGL